MIEATGRRIDVDERSERAALFPLPFTDMFVLVRCEGPPSADHTVDPRDYTKPFPDLQNFFHTSRGGMIGTGLSKRAPTTFPSTGHQQ